MGQAPKEVPERRSIASYRDLRAATTTTYGGESAPVPLELYHRGRSPCMRRHLRTVLVLALVVALLALFLHNVDLWAVAGEIIHAQPEWLALSLASMFLNLVLRAWRWQYLLEPLGSASFRNAFRATAVGFAASSVLPARAGEFIRPYFLARHERMSATGAFATIILERLLDTLTVLVLLAAYVFVFGRGLKRAFAVGQDGFGVCNSAGNLPQRVQLIQLMVHRRDSEQLRPEFI